MSKTSVVSNMTRKLNKLGFKIKQHSPEILIVAGVVGTVAGTVMACKATTKVNDILNSAKNDIDTIHKCTEDGYVENPENKEKVEYTEDDSKKDLTIVYAQTAVKVAKLYAPAVLVGALSLGAIISSHTILRKRNVALAAAYATIDKGFKEYRNRVVERFGREIDRELRFNVKNKEIEEKVVDEKGKETTVKKEIKVIDPNVYSDYARIYDDGCLGWTKDPELNLAFLKAQQATANRLLTENGYLYLNDVYKLIGFPATHAGQVVGWVYDEKNPVGDNFVDFGIYDLYNAKARDFVNGYERNIILDFNVDGNIWELMREKNGLNGLSSGNH